MDLPNFKSLRCFNFEPMHIPQHTGGPPHKRVIVTQSGDITQML